MAVDLQSVCTQIFIIIHSPGQGGLMRRILYTGSKKSNKVAGPPHPSYIRKVPTKYSGELTILIYQFFKKIFPIPDSFLLIAKQVMALYIMIVILIEVYIGSIMSHPYPNTAMREVEYLNSP